MPKRTKMPQVQPVTPTPAEKNLLERLPVVPTPSGKEPVTPEAKLAFYGNLTLTHPTPVYRGPPKFIALMKAEPAKALDALIEANVALPVVGEVVYYRSSGKGLALVVKRVGPGREVSGELILDGAASAFITNVANGQGNGEWLRDLPEALNSPESTT